MKIIEHKNHLGKNGGVNKVSLFCQLAEQTPFEAPYIVSFMCQRPLSTWLAHVIPIGLDQINKFTAHSGYIRADGSTLNIESITSRVTWAEALRNTSHLQWHVKVAVDFIKTTQY